MARLVALRADPTACQTCSRSLLRLELAASLVQRKSNVFCPSKGLDLESRRDPAMHLPAPTGPQEGSSAGSFSRGIGNRGQAVEGIGSLMLLWSLQCHGNWFKGPGNPTAATAGVLHFPPNHAVLAIIRARFWLGSDPVHPPTVSLSAVGVLSSCPPMESVDLQVLN